MCGGGQGRALCAAAGMRRSACRELDGNLGRTGVIVVRGPSFTGKPGTERPGGG